MLKALGRWLLREDAPKTQPQLVERVVERVKFVTPDELDAALKKFEERFEWEMSEWYDKFSTLHARASKRQQREQQPRVAGSQPVEGTVPSVLHHRRLGSV